MRVAHRTSTPKAKLLSAQSLGLALSGGSVKGFAHLGVLRYLEELGVHPNVIAGTSAGALVGAFYADGYKAQEILEIFSEMTLAGMTNLRPWGTGGLLDTTPFLRFVEEHLRHRRLEELPTPMHIVATDLDAGRQHIFTEGELAPIVVASCSIPVLFRPMEIEGVLYVDGGLFRNFPASVIRDTCDCLVGVNLGPWVGGDYEHTLASVAERAWQLVFRQNTLHDKALCDVLLETEAVQGYGLFDASAARKLEAVGYELAQRTFES